MKETWTVEFIPTGIELKRLTCIQVVVGTHNDCNDKEQ